jgi:GT2 family glycosyltransferase
MDHLERTANTFMPVRMLQTELSEPLPVVPVCDTASGIHYRRARALVRLHGQPLGLVELDLGETGVSAREYAQCIWRALRQEITEHLRQDDLPVLTDLDAAGLGQSRTPRCAQERDALLRTAPFASVVVATRDRPAQLAACLRSLQFLDYPDYEIIVVDNAPRTQETVSLLRDVYGDMTHVRYVREDCPGPSRARNRGIMQAEGEIIAFTDDDVLVDSRWLAELVVSFGRYEDVACSTGLVMPLEIETPAQEWFEQYGGFNNGFTRRLFDLRENRPCNALYPFSAGIFGSGNNMAFKASFFRSIGGFEPALGPGTSAYAGEDLDAFVQVITRGFKLVYEPAAIVHHQHRRDYDALSKQIYGYGVGLTAYLTKCLLDNPKLMFDFVRKVPYGFYYVLSAQSPKNEKKLAGYPHELTGLERKGMIHGPVAYVRSRRQARTLSRHVAHVRPS